MQRNRVRRHVWKMLAVPRVVELGTQVDWLAKVPFPKMSMSIVSVFAVASPELCREIDALSWSRDSMIGSQNLSHTCLSPAAMPFLCIDA